MPTQAYPNDEHAPWNVLIDVISNLMIPIFLIATKGDRALAALAARQTINTYRVQQKCDVLTVAQIAAFSLAALGSLGLSLGEDLPLPLILRLRANANACNRSAERNRRALAESNRAADAAAAQRQHHQPPTHQPPTPPAATPARPAQPAGAPQPAPNDAGRTSWAVAFQTVAAELTADLAQLPQADQAAASIQIAALTSTAAEMLSGRNLGAFPA